MALTAGTKLGPYEIVAPIGAGGMGEVYQAYDSLLGRDVAGQAQKDRWRQPTGRWRSERNSLAPQVGLEPTTLRLTARCESFAALRALVLARSPSTAYETWTTRADSRNDPDFALFWSVVPTKVPTVFIEFSAVVVAE